MAASNTVRNSEGPLGDNVRDCFLPVEECGTAVVISTDLPEINYFLIRAKNRKCKIVKPLILLKVSLFSFFGAYKVVYPFLVVLLKQKGLTASDFALAHSISPIFQFLAQFTIGIVSDKTGKYKTVLAVMCFMSLFFMNSFLFLPHRIRATKSNYNEKALSYLSHNCKSNSSLEENYTSCCCVDGRGLKTNVNDTFLEKLAVYNSTCDLKFNCTSSVVGSHSDEIVNESSTFAIVLASIMLIVQSMFGTSIFRCLDVISMQMVSDYSSDFGTQRFWSMLGATIIPVLGGYIVQLTSPLHGNKNCSAAIFLYDACLILLLACIWKLDSKKEIPAKKMCKHAKVLLKNIDVLMFLFVTLISGIAWCFYYYFSPYYVSQLNASAFNLGLKEGVEHFVGLPVVLASGWCIQKIGVNMVFLLALSSHMAQSLSISYIMNPWWSVACGSFHIFNYHLMWVAIVTQAHNIAPKTLTATLVILTGIVHYTVGKGIGSLLGGFLMDKFGGAFAFRTMAAMCGGTAIVYSLFLTYRRKWNLRNRQHSPQEN